VPRRLCAAWGLGRPVCSTYRVGIATGLGAGLNRSESTGRERQIERLIVALLALVGEREILPRLAVRREDIGPRLIDLGLQRGDALRCRRVLGLFQAGRNRDRPGDSGADLTRIAGVALVEGARLLDQPVDARGVDLDHHCHYTIVPSLPPSSLPGCPGSGGGRR
jgi:hypothetical protein